jgi:hypothetical protein
MADAPVANWTAADVERLSAQGWRVALWKGQLLRMAPTGDVHGRVTRRLDRALDRYVEAHSLGQLLKQAATHGARATPTHAPWTWAMRWTGTRSCRAFLGPWPICSQCYLSRRDRADGDEDR